VKEMKAHKEKMKALGKRVTRTQKLINYYDSEDDFSLNNSSYQSEDAEESESEMSETESE